MKKRSKRFLTMALAAAMSCSMITGWANTAEIVSVTVTDSANNVENVTAVTNFEVNPSDLVTVKVKIKDATPAAIADAEATFLTALTEAFGATLSDANIQYVDQQTTAVVEGDTDTEAYAVFTFRPRMEGTGLKLSGPHTAKVGGTAVTAVEDFTYTVKEADKAMTLAADDTDVVVGDTVTFTVAATPLPGTVTITGITPTTAYDPSTGKFTWTADAAGTKSVTVSADGYVTTTAVTINVTEPVVEIPPVAGEDVEDAKDAIQNVVVPSNPTGNTVELDTTTEVGGQKVRYTVEGGSDAVAYDAATGKITYTQKADGKFAERVKVVAQVGTDEQEITKVSYVYFVPGDIAFGNVTVVASGNDDAFATAAGVAAASADDKLEARAAALNIVLGKADENSIAAADKTLDWNHNGSIALSEYNIMRHMLNGNADYTPEKLVEKRPAKAAQ